MRALASEVELQCRDLYCCCELGLTATHCWRKNSIGRSGGIVVFFAIAHSFRSPMQCWSIAIRSREKYQVLLKQAYACNEAIPVT